MLRGRLVNGIPKRIFKLTFDHAFSSPSLATAQKASEWKITHRLNKQLKSEMTMDPSRILSFMVHFMPKRTRRARANISIRKKFFDPQRPNRWRRVHEVQFIANRAVSFNLFFVQPTLHVFSMCCYGLPRLLRDSSHLAFLIFMPRNDNN